MTRYNPQYEALIRLPRRRQRLVLAQHIHPRAPPADFKDICRSRLSDTTSVRFFWHPPNAGWKLNAGFVMIEFPTRLRCNTALHELSGMVFHTRLITVQRPSRTAFQPLLIPVAAAPTPAIATAPTAAATSAAPIPAALTTAATIAAPTITPAVVVTTTSVPMDDGDDDTDEECIGWVRSRDAEDVPSSPEIDYRD
ncbi:hypothetical protein EDB81DRAFT_142739 [Dactylonectria macrodidyma]|uniref:Uncharacterized protein n=1 Tax=Dactylonectria macrodidyma TaxID=307937 RepID=A0A9P9IQG1_9HYPO|nr:hypothetical protein EDB81DRAFT_142739 [Dactylonectria macrodidyma]